MEASYKGLFSVEGSADVEAQNARKELTSSSEHDVTILGGDATAASRIVDGVAGAFDQWLASVAPQPVPVSFTANGLKPLWELLPEQSPRRKELSDAYEPYATGRAGKNLEKAMPLREGDVVAFQLFSNDGWIEGDRGQFLRVVRGARTARARFTATGLEGSRLRLSNEASNAPIQVFNTVSIKDAPGVHDVFELAGPNADGLFEIKVAENRSGQAVKDSIWFLKEGDFGGAPDATQGTDGTVQARTDLDFDQGLRSWRIFVLGPPLGA